MNLLTKAGALLGAVAFATIATAGYHQYTEVQKYAPPPTLEHLLTSVVKVEAGGSICTGWVLKGTDEVVTAAHCFEFDPKASGAIIHFSDGSQAIFAVVAISADPSDDMHDWAVLKLNSGAKVTMPEGLAVCTSAPHYGDPVVVIGAPYNVYPSMTFGRVQNPSYHGDNTDVSQGALLIDVKILPGNSGGPVIDPLSGCVMGTAEELYNHGLDYGNIGIAAPIYNGAKL